MNWFLGDIGEAVKKVKSENRFLVVLVTDDSESSTRVENILNGDSFKTLGDAFVGLKLIKDSIPEKQFLSVYPIKHYPSVNVIGPNGTRLRQIDQELTSESLLKIIKMSKDEPKKPTNNPGPSNLQDLKEKQKEKELKEMKREQENDRLMSEEARKRVLQNIEDDKKEKEYRRNMQQTTSGPACPLNNPDIIRKKNICSMNTNQPIENYNGEVRIRLRFFNGLGGSHVIAAKSKDTIKDKIRPCLRSLLLETSEGCDEEFINQLVNADKVGYQLTQFRPPRSLTEADEAMTLEKLCLVPSGTLVIKPLVPLAGNSSTGIVKSIPSSIFSVISWSISLVTSSIASLFNAVTGRSSVAMSSEEAPVDSKTMKSGKDKKNSRVIKQGNTTRLSHMPDDSDDENARWNGNSTSQL